MNKIKISENRYIGENEPPFIIAEIGNNHNGSIDNAFELIKNANDIGAGLTSVIRGREGANPAEKAVTWFYRNLLLFPKGVSQLAKTVLSIPTHLRNFFSAGAFAGGVQVNS